MTLKQLSSRSLTVVLSAMLCNAPQYLAAQSTATPAQQASPDQNAATTDPQAAPAQNSQSGSSRPDPSQAPLAPVPSARPAENSAVPPDAPSEVQRSQQNQPPASPTAAEPAQQRRPANPLGTATAQQGATRGGAASTPAGEAIAPAKQRQVHSLLIKLGLVTAGAVAIGTVVGLTRGTSGIPPGAR